MITSEQIRQTIEELENKRESLENYNEQLYAKRDDIDDEVEIEEEKDFPDRGIINELNRTWYEIAAEIDRVEDLLENIDNILVPLKDIIEYFEAIEKSAIF